MADRDRGSIPQELSPEAGLRRAAAALVLLAAGAPLRAGEPSFSGVGVLPGFISSQANAVSGDGGTVVGICAPAGGYDLGHAYRWTAQSGMVDLGFNQIHAYSDALAVSADGAVIVGEATNYGVLLAFRWTAAGAQFLEQPPGTAGGAGFAVSADGSTTVGVVAAGGENLAFRWTVPAGMVMMGVMPGFSTSIAKGVSGDGGVIVGWCASTRGAPAYRWTQATGMVQLPPLVGGSSVLPYAVSADGTTIVGGASSSISNGSRAYRWTESAGPTDLGTIEIGGSAIAWAVSADGRTVVGESTLLSGSRRAFYWTASTGMLDLRDLLGGAVPDGWELVEATGVSGDGKTVAGRGLLNGQEQGWVASIADASCYANCDGSTLSPVLNINDFQCFLNRFAAGDTYANCDRSVLPPVLNVNDFQCFLNRFALGCP